MLGNKTIARGNEKQSKRELYLPAQFVCHNCGDLFSTRKEKNGVLQKM
jgi:hypothetical protein